jgi:type I restriction enzyme R subunit
VPIIISTIQKFPFIAQALRTLEQKGEDLTLATAGKCYAVIVDEAHSSQTGETASALRGMLNRDGIEAAIAAQLSDVEDENLTEEAKRAILRDTLQRGRQPNLSFFAFTATPKFKTKAMFDEPGPDGQSPFHEYTMKQAIEESFIMDVLKNYTTYKRFYGLVKQIENDPQVPKRAAAKVLTQFLTLHPHNIEQVVTIIVEHFRANVMHEIGGRAKAMVVTGSRLEAVRYKLAFDRYISERGYTGIKSLVAFSGTVEDPAIPESAYTEVGMNDGLPEAELPETFDSDGFRVLLVAEKYQTGFDQPLLQAMYVVKRLAGVQAVQTLSRLNRMAPGKARTFVLDFANEDDDIFKAFKPYYEDTPMGESVDPQRLNELQHRVLEWAIFTTEDVSAFSVVWYGKKKDHTATDHRTMNAILDRAVDAFQRLEEEEREEFRGQITALRNLYAFLSQIIPYQDSELEQFYVFCRNLISKLPPPGDGSSFTLDDEVALKYFRIQQMTQGSISLDDGEADPLKGPSDVGSGGRKDEEVGLKDLVERLNERFGTSFSRADQLFFEQVRESAEGDERIVEAALANKYDNFASYLERMLDELFIDRMDDNEEVFSKVMSDQPFRAAVHKGLARELYERIREGRRH